MIVLDAEAIQKLVSSSLSCYRHADLGGDFSGTSLFLGLQHASDDVRVMSIKQLKQHLESSPVAELTQDDIKVSGNFLMKITFLLTC